MVNHRWGQSSWESRDMTNVNVNSEGSKDVGDFSCQGKHNKLESNKVASSDIVHPTTSLAKVIA